MVRDKHRRDSPRFVALPPDDQSVETVGEQARGAVVDGDPDSADLMQRGQDLDEPRFAGLFLQRDPMQLLRATRHSDHLVAAAVFPSLVEPTEGGREPRGPIHPGLAIIAGQATRVHRDLVSHSRIRLRSSAEKHHRPRRAAVVGLAHDKVDHPATNVHPGRDLGVQRGPANGDGDGDAERQNEESAGLGGGDPEQPTTPRELGAIHRFPLEVNAPRDSRARGFGGFDEEARARATAARQNRHRRMRSCPCNCETIAQCNVPRGTYLSRLTFAVVSQQLRRNSAAGGSVDDRQPIVSIQRGKVRFAERKDGRAARLSSSLQELQPRRIVGRRARHLVEIAVLAEDEDSSFARIAFHLPRTARQRRRPGGAPLVVPVPRRFSVQLAERG